MKRNSLLGTLAVLAAGALWGTMGVFVRYFNGLGLGAMNVAAVRIYLTAALLSILCLIIRPAGFRISWGDCPCFLGTGLISIVFFTYCYFRTMERTTLALAAVLLYTSPVFVAMFSIWLFKEKLTARKAAACLLAILGCTLAAGLNGGTGPIPLRGLLTGLGSAVGYALYSIFGRYAIRRGLSSLTVSLYTFLFATVGAVFLTDFPVVFSVLNRPAPILMAVGMSVVTTVLPYLLYTYGLTRMESSRAAILACVEPVVAALVSAAFFSEPLGLFGIIGILLVLAAVVLLNLKEKREKLIASKQ